MPRIRVGTSSPGSKRFALVFGPLLALAPHFAPTTPSSLIPADQEVAFTLAGRATLAVVLWMALWWLTEAVPIAVTALLPIVLFPLLGIATPEQTTAPDASDVIFLFLGGLLIAANVRKRGLECCTPGPPRCRCAPRWPARPQLARLQARWQR